MSALVLIVDDSLTVRMNLADAFSEAGFEAMPCATAAEARDALARMSVDVLVLDVLLPDGDGIELLREVRLSPAGSRIVVLMLSSEAEVKDRVRAMRSGADEYVGKPYDVTYVVEKARELVRVRQLANDDGRSRILIVDDSVTFREELRAALEREGHTVLVATSGEEGLRVAARHRPNAIVVDGILPGIDGATVIRHVRLDAALRGTPCLLLTASDDLGAELRALDAGADAFVRKDDNLDVVIAKVAAVLRRAVTPKSEAVSVLGPRKILAVDDSPTYLQAIAGTLREEGYDVVLARSGEEALELLAVETVDCILLDLLMPGLGGKETCRRIKAAPIVRDVPLIMLTSLEERSAMLEGLAIGADDYIPKSSEFEVLKARVRAQIRRKQFEDQSRRVREELHLKEMEASQFRAAQELATTRAALIEELEYKNHELEAFSYSVSHDLRAPLRSIDGFSQILLTDHSDQLDAQGQDYLRRVRAASQRMAELIDDLLELSRVGRAELLLQRVDLSALAHNVIADVRRLDMGRTADFVVREGLVVDADRHLMRIVLENLLGNAWKFTSKIADARIEVGAMSLPNGNAYFIRDNGAGFSMPHANKLFQPFQRLHSVAEFPGTGIGLATTQRIISRHGGRVWAEGAVDHGATIFFALSRAAAVHP
ncbi:MAG TPA: response regulator [Gemmatimonadaceae bacterium]|nr:response regulator [Gemmatimonadaceae bacterium]